MNRLLACIVLAVLGALLSAPARAADEDVFAFVPSGGKTLLIQLVHSKPPAAEIRAILTGSRTRDQWQSYLQGREAAIPALKGLTDKQRLTLADYLSFNMPLAADKVPADPAKADWDKVLPPDGRDMVMDHCQFCHIITVVVTQDHTREGWIALMRRPSHSKVETSEKEREAMASYLVLNAAIPIDLVPEDLRAGGASY
jgi:mono/diheme cytochrome c family protein